MRVLHPYASVTYHEEGRSFSLISSAHLVSQPLTVLLQLGLHGRAAVLVASHCLRPDSFAHSLSFCLFRCSAVWLSH